MALALRSVLVVEGDPGEAGFLEQAFDRAGYLSLFRLVKDPGEALAYLRGADRFGDRSLHPLPSLILLGTSLPEKADPPLQEWIRELRKLKKVPVVLLTEAVDYANVKKVFMAGVTSYIVRPPGLEQMVDTMRTLLRYWVVLNNPP